jgi:hypothetical protein
MRDEMTRVLVKHDLDNKKAKQYFLDILRVGNALSKIVLEHLIFEEGVFYTLLTEDADLDQLYKFDSGGILPGLPEEEVFLEGFKKPFIGERINSIDPELAGFMYQLLNKDKERSIIFEDATQSIDDPNIDFFRLHGLSHNKEIYYLINQEVNSFENISKAIDESFDFWHFMCLITKAPFDDIEDKKFTLKKMKEVCENIEFLIIGAYDGEGYIFWERAEKNPTNKRS